MADDRIDVVFGAEFGDLVTGVQKVKDQIGTLIESVQNLGGRFQDGFAAIAASNEAAAQKTTKDWQAGLNVIDRSLDTMLKGVLEGTQTWQQAMGRLFDNLALAFIEAVVKMMVQWAAYLALTAAGSGGVANPFTGGGLGGLVGGIASGIGGLIGFDSGAWSVPADMVAIVHAGEMVLPADVAAAARAGGPVASFASGAVAPSAAGANFALNVSVQAIDAAGVASWANSNAKTLAATIAKYMGNNPSSRGDY